jgi:hypothetical protein
MNSFFSLGQPLALHLGAGVAGARPDKRLRILSTARLASAQTEIWQASHEK